MNASQSKIESGDGQFEQWSILELMGHRKLAGLVSEIEMFGSVMLRIDIPSTPPVTQFYGGSAVYCLTPTTEELARQFSQRATVQPVHAYELLPVSASVSDDDRFECEDDAY